MESILKEPVARTRPVAPYIGGKRSLANRLTKIIDGHHHTTYAEPFVGMGGVFLRRQRRPQCELINDISSDVATFFRILQRHYQAFLDMLKFQLATRADFDRLMKTDPSTMTDLERAARFLYLQRTAFGGHVSNRNFGVSIDRPARFDLTKLVPMLGDVHERLAGVTIERLPYADFIARYDRPSTLFFLDPPYMGNEGDYGAGVFSADDYEALRGLLAGLQGSFMMTLNDRPEVRRLFSAFDLEEVSLHYTVGAGVTKARELIISRLR